MGSRWTAVNIMALSANGQRNSVCPAGQVDGTAHWVMLESPVWSRSALVIVTAVPNASL